MEYPYSNTTQWIRIPNVQGIDLSGVIDTPGYYGVVDNSLENQIQYYASSSSSSTQPYIIHFDPSSGERGEFREICQIFYASDEPDELMPATDDPLDALYAAEKEEET